MSRSLGVYVVFLHVLLAVSGEFDAGGQSTDFQHVPVQVYVTFSNSTQKFSLHNGHHVPEYWVAAAGYLNSVNKTGWGELQVLTVGYGFNDSVQAYAAGLAEGYITRDLIALHWSNVAERFCPKPYTSVCQKLRNFLLDNMAWVKDNIQKYPDDPFWHHVDLFYKQVAGLVHGYQGQPGNMEDSLDPFGLYLLQIQDDAEGLLEVLQNKKRAGGPRLGHCSALVKYVTDEYPELLVSHNTWSGYETMLRVLKRYNFRFHLTTRDPEQAAGNAIVMSSYPGTLYSSDDFYITSALMAVMETTIENNNPDLWKYVKAEGCVLESVRSMIANRLAGSGDQWAELFSRYNSGTYNNQWMIVDFRIFQSAGDRLMPGVLTVLEQMPGYIEFADLTDILAKQTYWPSYNIPYYPKIFNMSHQEDLVKKYGNYFSYEDCPRARIFRRDHGKVKDRISATKLMRYNNFQHDPLSRCDCTPPYSAVCAIAARSDLNPSNGTYPFPNLGHRLSGAIDLKLTSSGLINWMAMSAISGPTFDQQPVFQWSTADPNNTVPHNGQPEHFKFAPVMFNGTNLIPDGELRNREKN